MINKDSVETAYCFFHQKWQVYSKSNIDWQRDDIEYTISQYVEVMDPRLYAYISQQRPDFLLCHATFAHDMQEAIARLEHLAQQF